MQWQTTYNSPVGEILLASDEQGLIGLWFKDQKYFGTTLQQACACGRKGHLEEGIRWLDQYFSGQIPDFTPPLHLMGTDFQKQVWRELLSIPYGQTITYGDLANALGKPRAFQAVGNAIGHNPLSIMIPCHRVLGKNGALTGYAGGLERKKALLELEGIQHFR